MQQMALSSTYPSLLVFARPYPPIPPAAEPDASGLGRRPPRLEQVGRSAEVPVDGPTFLDHLRRLAS
ncbi:MAG: hypothetical protein FJX60_06900 [Alphaproteobacteria bacterium]|nr:hypothetical protein [Alphaproteobacteria bacterium]